jgi:hypothetical protein
LKRKHARMHPNRNHPLLNVVTNEHPAKVKEYCRAGEHMKREVMLHSNHGFPDSVMHDVEHVDTNCETGTRPS